MKGLGESQPPSLKNPFEGKRYLEGVRRSSSGSQPPSLENPFEGELSDKRHLRAYGHNLQAWRIPLRVLNVSSSVVQEPESQPPSLENPFEGVSVNATLTLDGMVTTSKLGESL